MLPKLVVGVFAGVFLAIVVGAAVVGAALLRAAVCTMTGFARDSFSVSDRYFCARGSDEG